MGVDDAEADVDGADAVEEPSRKRKFRANSAPEPEL